MKNKQKKKFFYSPAFLLLALVVGAILFVSIISLLPKKHLTYTKKRQVKEEISELTQQKKSLESDISVLETELGKEKKIREEFGLVKEGEGVIMIVDENTATGEGSNKENKGGFFDFFRKLFSKS